MNFIFDSICISALIFICGICSYKYLLTDKPTHIIIAIDGNIGSGKSTLIDILKDDLSDKAYFIKEPVDKWTSIRDENGQSLLENFYQNKSRWSYSFQNFAYITRVMALKRAMKSGSKIIITERSTLTDCNIFAKMLYTDGYINNMEMDMYDTWFYEFNIPINFIVYLKTSVDNCQKRIKERNRDGEATIDVEYLNKLDNAHDEWLLTSETTSKILVLDGNIDFKNDPLVRKTIVKQFRKCLTKYC